MAKFKCKHSGTVLEFVVESDIVEMRRHGEYEEVVEEPAKAPAVVETKEQPKTKKAK